MDTKTKLLSAAEALFYRYGFAATGMDRLSQAADMSSRTLYKHAGSKTALITAVLTERDRRFLQRLDVHSVEALFGALEEWVRMEGCRGCLFLRAYGESGGDTPEIEAALLAHKASLFDKIQKIVTAETGSDHHRELAEQILILFEGATATAIYRGTVAVSTACHAAKALIQRVRS